MLALVLARRDFREADQIITLYTKERGKQEVLARGIKKIISKQSAHLEPFCVAHVTIEAGKEIDHLTKVQPLWYAENIRANLDKMMLARYAVLATDRLTHVGEVDKRIFDTLFSWLKYLDKSASVTPLLLDGYIAVLFDCLGFKPILDACVVCGKPSQEMVRDELDGRQKMEDVRRKNGFYFLGGGIICAECRKKKESIGEEIFDCGLKEVSDMALLLKGDWRSIARFALSDDEQKKVHRLVYEFAVYHSEKKLADWGRVIT